MKDILKLKEIHCSARNNRMILCEHCGAAQLWERLVMKNFSKNLLGIKNNSYLCSGIIKLKFMPEIFRFYGFSFFFIQENTNRFTFTLKETVVLQNLIGMVRILF